MEHSSLIVLQVIATFVIGLPLVGYGVKRFFDLF